MALLSKKEFEGVIDDGTRIRLFSKIHDLSMQAANVIDKNQSIDEYVTQIESLVSDLVKIPSGYNGSRVSPECGQHLIDDVKSLDSALIRNKWIMQPGTTVKDQTSTRWSCRLLHRLTHLVC